MGQQKLYDVAQLHQDFVACWHHAFISDNGVLTGGSGVEVESSGFAEGHHPVGGFVGQSRVDIIQHWESEIAE